MGQCCRVGSRHEVRYEEILRRDSGQVGGGARSTAAKVEDIRDGRRGEGRVGPALEGGELFEFDVCGRL